MTFERIEQLTVRAFIGLGVAGLSPIIGAATAGWIGWSMLVGGCIVYFYSLFAMDDE